MSWKKVPQPEGLISVLLDRDRDFGDRHDAAMDLSKYDGEAVEAALVQVASSSIEDPDIVEECEQSLIEVRRRKK